MLGSLVNPEPDLVMAGQAGDIKTALALLQQGEWHVAVVDLYLADNYGLELIKDIRVLYPGMRVLVISLESDPSIVQRTLGAGANGYWHKSEEPETFVLAVRTVLAGNTYLSDRSVLGLQLPARHNGSNGDGLSVSKLSDREFEIFELIGRGFSTGQIAATLHIGIHTIQTLRTRMKLKLGVTSAEGLIAEAVRWVESRKLAKISRNNPDIGPHWPQQAAEQV